MKSNYQLFKERTWQYLKSIGYTRNDSLNFALYSAHVTTVIQIQKGKYSNTYAMYNFSYCRKDNRDPCVWNSDFFHFRQDFFDHNGFLQLGSGGYQQSPFPVSLYLDEPNQIDKAIDVLVKVEAIFRGTTKEKMLKLYEKENWQERIEKLFS